MNFYESFKFEGDFIASCQFRGCLYLLTTRYLYRRAHEYWEVLTKEVPNDAKAMISFNDQLFVFTTNETLIAYER